MGVDESDIEYIEESYIDEFGNKITNKVAKIKDESFNNMLKEELEEQKRYSDIPDNKVSQDLVESDKFENDKMIEKLIDNDGSKHAPKSKDLKVSTITVIDSNGNEVKKSVFIDDQGNIVDESDIEYIEESYIDEYGNKITNKVAKIKDESFNKMLK